MAKPWSEKPLWERAWLGPHSKVYLTVGKLVGHLGKSAFAFWDAAKLEPGYDKLRYENVLRDLTVWAKREQGQYELHLSAKKILRIIIGPAPDAEDYASWWKARMVSVCKMREEGQPVEWAEAPPVPLPEDAATEKPAPRPRRKRAKKA